MFPTGAEGVLGVPTLPAQAPVSKTTLAQEVFFPTHILILTHCSSELGFAPALLRWKCSSLDLFWVPVLVHLFAGLHNRPLTTSPSKAHRQALTPPLPSKSLHSLTSPCLSAPFALLSLKGKRVFQGSILRSLDFTCSPWPITDGNHQECLLVGTQSIPVRWVTSKHAGGLPYKTLIRVSTQPPSPATTPSHEWAETMTLAWHSSRGFLFKVIMVLSVSPPWFTVSK